MGANHSHEDSNSYARSEMTNGGKKTHYHKGSTLSSEYIVKPSKKGSTQGKPSPPSQPQFQDVTHNSVTLTWLPPRHNSGSTIIAYTVEMTCPGKVKDKQWVTLTQSCQGNSYQVKNLMANTEYVFRVRAENIHGVSKPSRPSDPVPTKMYELDDKAYNVPAPEEKCKNTPKRRHSFNLHLESTVTTILNHTDIEVKPRATTISETERGETSKITTLQRDAAARSSLQPNRKRSLPILLPGTKTNSMLKLRDSQTLPNIKSAAGDSSDSLNRKRNTGSRAGSRSGSEGKLEETDGTGKRDRNESSTDDDHTKDGSSPELSKHGSDEDLDSSDPWERDETVSGVSVKIMSAPLCDDMKIALYSRSVPDDGASSGADRVYKASSITTWIGRNNNTYGDGVDPSSDGPTDFRTLRSLLHSDDIIVKPSRSLPDVTGACTGVKKLSVHRNNNNNNNKLSTIVDLEEDEESVRITTL